MEKQEQRSPTGRRLRFDKGQRQLLQRDLDILRLVGEQYTYRFDQLQSLLARHSNSVDPKKLSETRTRAAIQKWQQLGLARSRKILHKEPGHVWLTRKGLRHMGLKVAYWEPEHSNLDHYSWINEVRARLDATYLGNPKYQDYEWESERLWRAARDRWLKEKKAAHEVSVPASYQGKHRPDAVMHYSRNGYVYDIAIEVQLSAKTFDVFTRAWDDLVQHFDAVWYYVSPEVKPTLLEALADWQTDESPKYRVAPMKLRQNIHVYDLQPVLQEQQAL